MPRSILFICMSAGYLKKYLISTKLGWRVNWSWTSEQSGDYKLIIRRGFWNPPISICCLTDNQYTTYLAIWDSLPTYFSKIILCSKWKSNFKMVMWPHRWHFFVYNHRAESASWLIYWWGSVRTQPLAQEEACGQDKQSCAQYYYKCHTACKLNLTTNSTAITINTSISATICYLCFYHNKALDVGQKL